MLLQVIRSFEHTLCCQKKGIFGQRRCLGMLPWWLLLKHYHHVRFRVRSGFPLVNHVTSTSKTMPGDTEKQRGRFFGSTLFEDFPQQGRSLKPSQCMLNVKGSQVLCLCLTTFSVDLFHEIYTCTTHMFQQQSTKAVAISNCSKRNRSSSLCIAFALQTFRVLRRPLFN